MNMIFLEVTSHQDALLIFWKNYKRLFAFVCIFMKAARQTHLGVRCAADVYVMNILEVLLRNSIGEPEGKPCSKKVRERERAGGECCLYFKPNKTRFAVFAEA